jgi:HEAT repeat protein
VFEALKIRKLAGAIGGKNTQEAYSAVLELGRVGTSPAIEALAQTLGRRDGLARSAARELGRLKAAQAVPQLVEMLSDPEVDQAAADALGKIGEAAVEAVLPVSRSSSERTRRLCVEVFKQTNHARSVERLAELVQGDPDYEIRIAAATALGQLKDSRGVWALVNVLKLRDETTPEGRAALERLRQAATLAMRRIGDPLAKRATAGGNGPVDKEEPVAQAQLHARVAGNLETVDSEELVAILKELVHASEEISWAKLEKREPHLAPHFSSYELRSRTAELIGQELHRRGGPTLIKDVLKTHLSNHVTIRNWWEQLL